MNKKNKEKIACNILQAIQCSCNILMPNEPYTKEVSWGFHPHLSKQYYNLFKGHINHLRLVFEALREAGLIVKIKKCDFARKKLKFLEHIISREGIRIDPKK